MRHRCGLKAIAFFIVLAIYAESAPSLSAQAPIPTPQQLDQLLAPVALYPDSLLAQITTAATDPQEILDVDNWMRQNSALSGAALSDAAEKQGFDPAFIALVNFPGVLDMMAQNVDDYAAIGQAFAADQGAVAASIQRLRAQAYAAGSLTTNPQQKVEVQQQAGQPIYVIQPANPQVVYVPIYNPTVVYFRPPTPVVFVTFGPPIPIGFLMVTTRPWGWMGWGWNWGMSRCYYNHAVWAPWRNPYRPPVIWYRPRPVLYTSRPGYGGNWNYRPPNYRPPVPGTRPPNRYPWGPTNPPGHHYPVRPPTQLPAPGRPAQPIARPGTPTQPIVKPGTGVPPKTRPPGAPNQNKPTQLPANRPPANGVNRPAPARQPKPRPPSGR